MMLIVRVELHSAVTGQVSEIARLEIVNDGFSMDTAKGNYDVRTLRGRGKGDLDKHVIQRAGRIEDWPRLSKHVWSLVAKALGKCGYGYGFRPNTSGNAAGAKGRGVRRTWAKGPTGVGVP